VIKCWDDHKPTKGVFKKMAIFNKFQSFVEKVAEKIHNLGADQITVALTNVQPVNTNNVLTDITQIAYTFCSTRDIVTTSSAQTGGVYKLTLTDLILTATGGAVGPFRWVVLYNSTAAGNDLIGWYEYGAAAITLADGEQLTLDFDDANGVFTIT